MAYQEIPMETKVQLVCRILGGEKILPVSREFRVSRPSAYHWVCRSKRAIEEVLRPEKRGPKQRRPGGDEGRDRYHELERRFSEKEKEITRLKALLKTERGDRRFEGLEGLFGKDPLPSLCGREFEFPGRIGRPIKESILTVLREAIYAGYFLPGSRLVENDLASRFKVSRTPVREAFRQLEAEGLIEVQNNKGARVSRFSPQDIQSMYIVSAALEGMAAYRAAPMMGPEEWDLLEALHRQMQSDDLQANKLAWFRTNRKFHAVYLKRSGCPRLLKLINQQISQIDRYWFIGLSVNCAIQRHNEHHERIIVAFKGKDPCRVQKEVQDHFLDSSDLIVRFLETLAHGHPTNAKPSFGGPMASEKAAHRPRS